MEKLNKSMDIFKEFKSLLKSDQWPTAVDPLLICDTTSDQDKQDRAEGILGLIMETHLENLKFLDFGCGEGHVIMKSLEQKPQFSIGYDIQKFDKWNELPKNEKAILTTNWGEVEKNRPYNVVLIYDVLDHMMNPEEEIITKLKEIKNLLAPDAKIYVRCHPWCSRHGTHLYHKINKAYIHLVFEDHELEEMGYIGFPTRKIIHPATTYENWFKLANLQPINKGANIFRKQVDAFFIHRKKIAQKIKSRWKESHMGHLASEANMPIRQIEQEFVDYTLISTPQ